MTKPHDRKYNIRGILREVRKRERDSKKALNIINNLSTQDLINGERLSILLSNRKLHLED